MVYLAMVSSWTICININLSLCVLSDVDECVEAALAERMICPHSAQYCVNNPGGYECICPGDTELIDGECVQCKHEHVCNIHVHGYCITISGVQRCF